MMRAAGLSPAAGLAMAAFAAVSHGHAQEALAPYQMVRSLQLVQDRIASGDQAALPMQAKLLELVDKRLRKASGDDLKEPKNLRALLVYGMSGGNPVTVKAAAARVEMDAGMQAVSAGVLAYLGGRPADAIEALKPVDPMALPADLGAFVALVKGSLLATEDPAQALALLDRARLLSPGTLVEEAALRRSVGIAMETGDAARFLRASTQYVAHYLRSPYASQFADAFVAGVVAMNEAIGRDRLLDITSMMDGEREKVVYLRISRAAALDGLSDLSAFAAAQAERHRTGRDNGDDPRALLYASLSALTSATAEDLREKLRRIDRNRLSESDRALFDAATAVSREIAAPPAAAVAPQPPQPLAPAQPGLPPDMPQAGAAAPGEEADLPPVEGAVSERPAVQAEAEPPAAAASPPAAPAAPAGGGAAPLPVEAGAVAVEGGQPADAADAAIADARRKLEQIDEMLGTSPQ